ncbi:hypothetical protein FQR65_LT12398 [Abscondita terminalis]|nr:hypothetical protein FQR65_LT12398 [Abscondita terminalis]
MDEELRVKLTKRSDTKNVGKDYELKIAALLALRCIENRKIKHAWIASDVKHAGALDDIILYVNDVNDVSCAYLIQLKHQDNPKNIPRRNFLYDVEKKKKNNMDEDFSLFKYYRTYLKIQSNLRQDDCKYEDDFVATLREVDKIFYLIYTNRPLGAEYEFINVCRDVETLLDIKTGKEKIYGFQNCKEFDDDFLRNFKLFTEQGHITQVDGFIKMELKRILSTAKKSLDVNNLYESYMNFARANIQNVNGSFEPVTTTDIIRFITSFYLNRYRVKEFSLKYSNEPQFAVWKEIIEGKNLVVVKSSAKDFLESYVSANIAHYFKYNNWNQYLSKDDLDQKFPYLKPLLLKLMGDRDLTVSLVYEALWLQGRVPFLGQINKLKDLKRIQSVQRLMQNFSYQVIILSNFDIDIVGSPNCLFNLNHLDYERQKMILTHPITLQKRCGTCLENLINKSMYKFVQCNEMIDIITDRYNIGDAQGKKLDHYVQRSVSRILFSTDTLETINSKVLIRGIDRTTFEQMLKSNKTETSNIIFENDLRRNDKDYHEFRYMNPNTFELQRNCGSVVKFRENQLIRPRTIYEFDNSHKQWLSLEELFNQDLCVINAYPGMGKTEFFNHAALNAPTYLWVIKIILSKHHDYYETVDETRQTVFEHLNYFFDTNTNDKLTKQVFSKFVKRQNVLVLLDGVDEINKIYLRKVTLIAKSLIENGFKVWMSTRPVTNQHLEEALNTVSRTLKPLSTLEQRTFLNNSYRSLIKDEDDVETIKKFIKQLLKAVADNLSDVDNKFTSVPLQTKLIANVFEEDLKRILVTKDFTFNDKFDLVDVYETFLKKKNKFFNEKYYNNFINIEIIENFQKLCGLLLVFSEFRLTKLQDEDKKFHEDMKIYGLIDLIGRDGVMWLDSGTSQISFVHKTFAEFLAAKWLYENWKRKDLNDLMKCRFEMGYEFVFSVFDRYVAKRLPLHLNIISRNSKTLDLIKSNPKLVGLKDECDRTVWHLLTCYLSDKESFMILNQLSEHVEVDAPEKLLGYNALEYALCNKSYTTADKLCQISKNLSLKSIDLILISGRGKFDIWSDLRLKHLFLRVLPHFARFALLLNYWNAKILSNVEEDYEYRLNDYPWRSFLDVRRVSGKNARLLIDKHSSVASFILDDRNYNYYLSEYPWESLVDFVKNRFSDDVFFAAAFGTKQELSKTLKKNTNITNTDIYNYTPLHYASIHNNLRNAKYLISKSKKMQEVINVQGHDGNAAIHLALRESSFDVANFLIKENADLTLVNNYGMTPFLYACESGEIGIVKKIRSKIKDINLKNGDGKSALHLASTNSNNS